MIKTFRLKEKTVKLIDIIMQRQKEKITYDQLIYNALMDHQSLRRITNTIDRTLDEYRRII
jgi:hypothetical protein